MGIIRRPRARRGPTFLLDFCRLLGLDEPDPPRADNERNAYTFERRVERKKADGSTAPNWIDLCKSRHFAVGPTHQRLAVDGVSKMCHARWVAPMALWILVLPVSWGVAPGWDGAERCP